MAKTFSFPEGNTKTTVPLSPHFDLKVPKDHHATQDQITGYKRRIGKVNFAAIVTRPDVAKTLSILSTITNPAKNHFQAIDHCI
jgi:hypothetical protein